jgi:hypothetical protein
MAWHEKYWNACYHVYLIADDFSWIPADQPVSVWICFPLGVFW